MEKRSFINRFPILIRTFNWEFWPANLVYAPVIAYYTWFAIRARSFFFFSASNPAIETGGMFFESKWDIFKLLPKHSFPATILIGVGTTKEELRRKIKESNLTLPLIAKPDRGERGWLVKKLDTELDLENYLLGAEVDFLIQQYVDMPLELSIFYYRLPGTVSGILSSMVQKEMLSITCDGQSTVRQLIKNYPRALLQLPILEVTHAGKMDLMPADGEKIQLVPIGNHSKGAKFIDLCHLIDEQLTKTIDELSKQIPGFYFGRYDLRCESIDSLRQGKGYRILELNGCGAEPAHIYNPGFSLFKAYGVLFHHLRVMYQISAANHRQGVPYMSAREFFTKFKLRVAYQRKGNNA